MTLSEEDGACSWHVLVLGSDSFSTIHQSSQHSMAFFDLPFTSFLSPDHRDWSACRLFHENQGLFLSLRLWLKMSWRKEGELSFVSGPSSLCGREVTSDPQSCLVFGWKAEGDGRSWKPSSPKGSSSPGRPSHHLPWVSTLVNPLPQGQHSSGASLKATDGKWKSLWEKCPLSLSLFHPSLSKWPAVYGRPQSGWL